jgi:hypothetical protein
VTALGLDEYLGGFRFYALFFDLVLSSLVRKICVIENPSVGRDVRTTARVCRFFTGMIALQRALVINLFFI